MTRRFRFLAGVPGAELIRRRADGMCVGCGFVEVFPKSPGGEVPWLCEACIKRQPKRARFDHRRHREEGIKNLERLDRKPE